MRYLLNTFSAFQRQRVLIRSTIIAFALLGLALLAGQIVPVQRGLLATYYPNPQWSLPAAFSVVDASVNLDTAYNRRLVFPENRYSIHWKGWLWIEQPGKYQFATRSDDGSNLYLDGKLLIDNGGLHAIREVAENIRLEAGFHQIDIGYFQGEARDEMAVYWQPPGQKRTILPTKVLFPEKPRPGTLLLEQVIPWSIWILTFLTVLLLGLTVSLHGRSLYQGLKVTVQESIKPQKRVQKFTGGLWQAAVARKQLRLWIGGATAVLLLAFLALYHAHTEHGLVGMYYDNRTWNNLPVFSTPDCSLTPDALYQKARRPQEPNSLRWAGWLLVETAAEYHFRVKTEGALTLQIDEAVVLEKTNNDRVQTGFSEIYLPKGIHQIALKYRPGTGTAHILDLRWGTQEAAMHAIPGHLLFQEKPSARQVSVRILSVWAYRGILWLGVIAGAIISIGVLVHQVPVYAWLAHTSLFRNVSKFTIQNAFMRNGFQQSWAHLLIIVILSLLLVFYNLGRGSIITTDFDEGVHTRVAQYMAKTGNWWSLSTSEGVPYYNKPPLKIWLSALTLRVFGDSEFVLRIWDAVFGLLTFMVVYAFGRVLFSSKTVGLLAVLILMGCRDFLLNHNIRTGVMDSLMVFFVVSSLLLFRLREKRAYFYYLSGLCMGFGALTKSVQALVPLVIVVLYLVLTKQLAELKTVPFWGMVCLAFLLPALWYVPQMMFSPGFFDVAIVQQIFHRVQGRIHRSHVHGPWYFFQVIYHGFFPWSLLAVPALGMAFWQAIWRKNREMIFLLTWILTVFLGFSVSKMKVAWYMNPLYPALSLLIAVAGYTLIKTLHDEYPTCPLLAPLATGVLLVLLLASLGANFQRVHAQTEKLPIHIFTDYLHNLSDTDYQMVFYDIAIHELDYADSYYLDRIPEECIIHTNDIRAIEQFVQQPRPAFLLLKRSDYDTHPVFQEHLSHFWLAPVYANELYPQKLILVYNHIPESQWFILNIKTSKNSSNRAFKRRNLENF